MITGEKIPGIAHDAKTGLLSSPELKYTASPFCISVAQIVKEVFKDSKVF